VAFPTRTLVALLAFAACGVVATFLPHPTHGGPLLTTVRPDVEGLGGSDEFFVPPKEESPVVVRVALPAGGGPPPSTTAPTGTPTATPTTSAPSSAFPAPGRASTAAADHPDDRSRAAPAATSTTTSSTTSATRSATTRAARTREVLQAIDTLLVRLGPDPQPLTRPCVEGDEQRGCRRRALDHLYAGLLEVALGETRRPVRISQFGDSLVAREHFPAALRQLLQEQFGDGGHGFVPVAEPGNGVYAADVVWSSRGYTKKDIAWHSGVDFGVGGAVWRATPDATTTVGPALRGPGSRIDRVGLLYVPAATTTSVVITDREWAAEVPLRGLPGRARVAWLPWNQQAITLQRWRGDVALHGLLLQNEGPGVIVDNLGVVSSRMPFVSRINAARLNEEIALLDPTVLSFFYGGVAIEDAGWGEVPERTWGARYRAEYESALGAVRRAHPDRDCLVLSTFTRAVDENGRIAVFPAVPFRIEAQEAAARAQGCAFWNTFEAVGGRDGAARWVAHRPRLLALDLRHPTRDGYRQLARMFYASLMHGFRSFLVEQTEHGA
jgi:hypothetical protein